MQSPTNKFNQSFSSLFPNINKNIPLIADKNHNFQLNNEGCKCQLCQKIIIKENLKILIENINDSQSEQFQKNKVKQHYIDLIQEMAQKWKFKRSIRFYLPQICLYEANNPVALIQKKRQSNPLTINKSKSRLHFFQIQSFFLHGYISQIPSKKARSTKNQALHKAYINQCIVFAKYLNNTYRMLTYNQIEAMFRSKNKSMKDGLMYLQTVVGGDYFKYTTIIVKLDQINKNQQMQTLWERAKLQVKIISNQVKLIDTQFYEEQKQIQFQNQLKYFDFNQYLLYLSYKIILMSSKFNTQIIKNSVFKYAVVGEKPFLFDLRVIQLGQNAKYWSSNVMEALQIKLKKTMSQMELENPEKQFQFNIFENQLSRNAQNLSEWLRASTQDEWQEMKVIRKRLQKLEQEKVSLQKSKHEQMMRKNFKVRSVQLNKVKQKNQTVQNFTFNNQCSH